MDFGRVLIDGQPVWTIVEDGIAYKAEGDLYDSPTKGASLGEAATLKQLVPIDRHNQVVGLFGNWFVGDRHGPGIFIKPSSAHINPGDPVAYPPIAKTVYLEPEIGVVIGKRCRNVKAADAKDHILGYVVCNDLTAFEVNVETTFPIIMGKMFDTFSMIGPLIRQDIDPLNATLRAAIDGEEFLVINSGKMAWNVFEIVQWVSSVMTLHPGDIISCGAPPGIDARSVEPGHRITVTIDEIGVIDHQVYAENAMPGAVEAVAAE